MTAKDILLLGVNGTVIAFNRSSGAELWRMKLGRAGFVSLLADEYRVFAHVYGEIFCLHLATGELMWHDKLPGMGYGIASLAFPDGVSNSAETAKEYDRQASDSSSSNMTTSS